MADLEHITAEGETYDISDATARAHNDEQDETIESLQTENANLKSQIADLENEISQLNSDLTYNNYQSLSSLISSKASTQGLQYVERCGYMCHLHLALNFSTTPTSGDVLLTLPEGFRTIRAYTSVLMIAYRGTDANLTLNFSTNGNVTLNAVASGYYALSMDYYTA